VAQCVVVGAGVVRDRAALTSCWLYPLRDFFGFVFWCASFLGGDRITWRGDRYVILPGGRMHREDAPEPQGKPVTVGD
jgi:hypothetical protein